jgi:hypothetical protein
VTITAFRNPTLLTFDDFDEQAVVIDPADGSVNDAFTRFAFELMPDLPAERVQGRFRIPRSMAISITPDAKIRTGAPRTADLLAHEQLHYDVGFVIARQLARELNVIDDATEPGLRAQVDSLFKLHFTTRAKLIQTRYDRETNHGLNAHFQKYWSDKMRACLADRFASQIGGWWL